MYVCLSVRKEMTLYVRVFVCQKRDDTVCTCVCLLEKRWHCMYMCLSVRYTVCKILSHQLSTRPLIPSLDPHWGRFIKNMVGAKFHYIHNSTCMQVWVLTTRPFVKGLLYSYSLTWPAFCACLLSVHPPNSGTPQLSGTPNSVCFTATLWRSSPPTQWNPNSCLWPFLRLSLSPLPTYTPRYPTLRPNLTLCPPPPFLSGHICTPRYIFYFLLDLIYACTLKYIFQHSDSLVSFVPNVLLAPKPTNQPPHFLRSSQRNSFWPPHPGAESHSAPN